MMKCPPSSVVTTLEVMAFSDGPDPTSANSREMSSTLESSHVLSKASASLTLNLASMPARALDAPVP